ncbi:glycosyltransferase [Rhodococcus sp. IEGM 1343]|uniref:glycosyltransferase n=1 Tax=Rhodococcus sp. IEGM 1343 TaxID=3082224 RepID=UPI0029549E77|nr:glycosyltransferase [Rhodococcus sp. IEGM 1343]MDV8055962.1 glycosyltransferase [Rhodococcus sp. IEGM 1343]
MSDSPVSPDVLRVYDSVRTTHLTLLETMVPGHLLYRDKMYDYEEPPNGTVSAERSGLLSTVRTLLTTNARFVELNEPLMIRVWPSLVPQTLALLFARYVLRRHFTVTTYVIENNPPGPAVSSFLHVPQWAGSMIARAASRVLLAPIDRIGFGTDDAYRNLRDTAGPTIDRKDVEVRLELPNPCPCVGEHPSDGKAAPVLLFVGELSARKGVPELMLLWDAISENDSRVRQLVVLGKGPMEAEVTAWATGREDIELKIDPSREVIHRHLREATVQILLSQSTPRWREQIGLPNMEGLAHGCVVASTDQTGYAGWLREHGHIVVEQSFDVDALASAVVSALHGRSRVFEITASLPASAVRTDFDTWMNTAW